MSGFYPGEGCVCMCVCAPPRALSNTNQLFPLSYLEFGLAAGVQCVCVGTYCV